MSHDSFHLDAVINVESTTYRAELTALFKSCAINPLIPEKNEVEEFFKKLAVDGSKHLLYVTDNIKEDKIQKCEQIDSLRIENILLVDENTKDNIIIDSEELQAFNHVLSYSQQHIPRLQLMSTIRKIREQKFFGVDKCLSHGVSVHKYILCHSDQRQWFRDTLFEFVKVLSNVLGSPTDAYAQFAVEVQEKLLINAIWVANPKLKDTDRREPISLLPQETIQIEWSFDGTHLAIGVRDPFGTFARQDVQKCLKALERPSSLIMTVAPGKATEVIAILNLTTSLETFTQKQRSFQFFAV